MSYNFVISAVVACVHAYVLWKNIGLLLKRYFFIGTLFFCLTNGQF